MNLVVISLEQWDEIWRRNQHLVSRLLQEDRDLRVLFVEPARDPLHDVISRKRPSRGRGLLARVDVLGAEGRLWCFQPTKWLPRRFHQNQDRRWAASVRAVSEKVGIADPILWVNDPTGAEVQVLTGWPTLYDITDDWLAADRPNTTTERLREYEGLLLRGSGAVVVCSEELGLRKQASRPTYLIRNGVDLEAYQRPRARPRDLPPGENAVYVGTVHRDRLDVGLCVRTAAQLKNRGNLVLVGPRALSAGDERSLREAGVVLLGSRPAVAVPAYLQHAGVLVVPHLVNAFTDSLDPIKAYEYLAVRKPVVSTPVAGFRDQPTDWVWTVESQGFPEAVLRALDRDVSELPSASVQDWHRSALEMKAVLDRLAQESRP